MKKIYYSDYLSMKILQENKQNKVFLSLSAIMFFAPLVKNLLEHSHLTLEAEDKEFINWYCKLGYFIIFWLFIAIINGFVSFFMNSAVLERINIILTFGIIATIITGSIMIFSDKQILQTEEKLEFKEIQKGDSNIFMAFLPFYNFFLRYKLHNFEKPFRWLKESLLRRTLFILASLLLPYGGFDIAILLLIIIRVATLLGGIDLINDSIKELLNTIFTTNIEEIRAYIKGPILLVIDKIKKNLETEKLSDYIQAVKKDFWAIYAIKNNRQLYTEYIILVLVIGRNIFIIYQDASFNSLALKRYIPRLMIISRFLIMLPIHGLPKIPIIHEITAFWRSIGLRIQSKIQKK